MVAAGALAVTSLKTNGTVAWSKRLDVHCQAVSPPGPASCGDGRTMEERSDHGGGFNGAAAAAAAATTVANKWNGHGPRDPSAGEDYLLRKDSRSVEWDATCPGPAASCANAVSGASEGFQVSGGGLGIANGSVKGSANGSVKKSDANGSGKNKKTEFLTEKRMGMMTWKTTGVISSKKEKPREMAMAMATNGIRCDRGTWGDDPVLDHDDDDDDGLRLLANGHEPIVDSLTSPRTCNGGDLFQVTDSLQQTQGRVDVEVAIKKIREKGMAMAKTGVRSHWCNGRVLDDGPLPENGHQQMAGEPCNGGVCNNRNDHSRSDGIDTNSRQRDCGDGEGEGTGNGGGRMKNELRLCSQCASKIITTAASTPPESKQEEDAPKIVPKEQITRQNRSLDIGPPFLDDRSREDCCCLIARLEALKKEAIELQEKHAATIGDIHPHYKESAKNLIHYFSLRNTDIREVQYQLVSLGLSSLGHLEAHVLAHINGVTQVLSFMVGETGDKWRTHAPLAPLGQIAEGKTLAMTSSCISLPLTSSSSPSSSASALSSSHSVPIPRQVEASGWGVRIDRGHQQLEYNTEQLLGPRPKTRSARIMVTLPREAQDDIDLITNLLNHGMNVARVNCAYDDEVVWDKIVSNVRQKSQELNKECKILMDLGGAKLRTGPLCQGPCVVSFAPKEDPLGRKIAPATIWLSPPKVPVPHGKPCDACVPVLPADFPAMLQTGDRVEVQDARGKVRTLIVSDTEGEDVRSTKGCFLQCLKRTILKSGTKMKLLPRENGVDGKGQEQHMDDGGRVLLTARIQQLKAADHPIVVMKNDTLILTRDLSPGYPEVRCNLTKELKRPGQIPCPVEEVFDCAKKGEPLLLDDGRIKGRIEEIDHDRIVVRIENADAKGTKLRADKGINLPLTKLKLKGLIEKDVRDLDFIASRADMVGFSFANDAEDVEALQRELVRRCTERKVGIVLKIETQRGFNNLPWMLLTAMKTANPIGVMIARGDLAAECGWERMAEIQEEILWACEAGHVPVIWATQVLDRLAKTGTPTRAEITDAAMGERAECVMLNKGPMIVDAARSLDNILGRMHNHQKKKQPLLRTLQLARKFFEGDPGT